MIQILIGLKALKTKVKLTLINLVGIAEKTVSEDSLLGLEIDARKALEAKQNLELHYQSKQTTIQL